LQGLEASLAPDEKIRAARFVFQRDRDHFIAARGILRILLGAYVHQPASTLNFTYGLDGKPALRVNEGEPSIHFNLSHSHGLAVYAISNHREVGIDVEAIRPGVAGEEIAGRFFSTSELAELHSLPREFRDEGFHLCWTRKEAYIKATGSGMRNPLNSFDVSLTPGQPELLRCTDSGRWTLRSFQPAPGYVGAVVGEGTDWRLRLWNWVDRRPKSES
jgi:4'-phosphopantetheinyl transferase